MTEQHLNARDVQPEGGSPNNGAADVRGSAASAMAQSPSSLWADCWYPWLDNGWIRCACGDYFHSSRDSTAAAKHERHVKEAAAHATA